MYVAEGRGRQKYGEEDAHPAAVLIIGLVQCVGAGARRLALGRDDLGGPAAGRQPGRRDPAVVLPRDPGAHRCRAVRAEGRRHPRGRLGAARPSARWSASSWPTPRSRGCCGSSPSTRSRCSSGTGSPPGSCWRAARRRRRQRRPEPAAAAPASGATRPRLRPVPTVLLVRHGRTTANAGGVLAGWTPGVGLDDTGRGPGQALAAAAGRCCRSPPSSTSPLQRCQETAAELVAVPGPKRAARPEPRRRRPAGGVPLRGLDRHGRSRSSPRSRCGGSSRRTRPRSTFPGDAGRVDARDAARAPSRPSASTTPRSPPRTATTRVWVAVSHGDVIKAVLADALGMHLDAFQRIVGRPLLGVASSGTPRCGRSPCGSTTPAATSAALRPRRRAAPRRRRVRRRGVAGAASDAVVGGGTGRRA